MRCRQLCQEFLDQLAEWQIVEGHILFKTCRKRQTNALQARRYLSLRGATNGNREGILPLTSPILIRANPDQKAGLGWMGEANAGVCRTSRGARLNHLRQNLVLHTDLLIHLALPT